jgi:hypothetical protein
MTDLGVAEALLMEALGTADFCRASGLLEAMGE